MVVLEGIDERELARYARRVGDRWPLQAVHVGGARVQDAHGAPPQRERGPEWVVVLVSERFDGVPWLERVHVAAALWDGAAMGGPADVHCYTPAELARKRDQLPRVRAAVGEGVALGPDGRPGPVSA